MSIGRSESGGGTTSGMHTLFSPPLPSMLPGSFSSEEIHIRLADEFLPVNSEFVEQRGRYVLLFGFALSGLKHHLELQKVSQVIDPVEVRPGLANKTALISMFDGIANLVLLSDPSG